MGVEISSIKDIINKKGFKVSYIHDALIDDLKEKINKEISSFNINLDNKIFLVESIEREIFVANGYILKYEDTLKDKEKKYKSKSKKDVDFLFSDYKMVKKSYLKAIECLKKYILFLSAKREIIKKSRKSQFMNITPNYINDHNNLAIALDDAVAKKFLHPDKRKLLSGISLYKFLSFLEDTHNLVLDKKDIHNLFTKSTGEPYKTSYCTSVLCDIHAVIKKQQNKIHKYS